MAVMICFCLMQWSVTGPLVPLVTMYSDITWRQNIFKKENFKVCNYVLSRYDERTSFICADVEVGNTVVF